MGEQDHLGGFAHGEQRVEHGLAPRRIAGGDRVIKDEGTGFVWSRQMLGQRHAQQQVDLFRCAVGQPLRPSPWTGAASDLDRERLRIDTAVRVASASDSGQVPDHTGTKLWRYVSVYAFLGATEELDGRVQGGVEPPQSVVRKPSGLLGFLGRGNVRHILGELVQFAARAFLGVPRSGRFAARVVQPPLSLL